MIVKNARILLPDRDDFFLGDVRISDGLIQEWGEHLEGEEVMDAQGLVLAPGFIDLHVHMREPGAEHKGTFESEGQAAAKGGFTHVFAMPNTSPSPDTRQNYQMICQLAQRSPVAVTLYGSVTLSIAGENLSDMEGLYEEGCRFYSDDGAPIRTSEQMLEALQRIEKLDGILAVHEEEKSLFTSGSIHRGKYIENFDVDGIPSSAEWHMIQRDLELLKQVPEARLHICHLSAKESVALIKEAKEQGLQVTAEVCPHHLALTEDILPQAGTLAKVNPPIREEEDRRALIDALKSGVIDIIATDHAPHDEKSKQAPMEKASFGLTGFELAFSLSYTALVETGELSLIDLLRLMSEKPAALAGIREGKIEKGYPANLVLLDPDEEWTLRRQDLLSKGKNTPLDGSVLKGRIKATMMEGRWIYEDTR